MIVKLGMAERRGGMAENMADMAERREAMVERREDTEVRKEDMDMDLDTAVDIHKMMTVACAALLGPARREVVFMNVTVVPVEMMMTVTITMTTMTTTTTMMTMMTMMTTMIMQRVSACKTDIQIAFR